MSIVCEEDLKMAIRQVNEEFFTNSTVFFLKKIGPRSQTGQDCQRETNAFHVDLHEIREKNRRVSKCISWRTVIDSNNTLYKN